MRAAEGGKMSKHRRYGNGDELNCAGKVRYGRVEVESRK